MSVTMYVYDNVVFIKYPSYEGSVCMKSREIAVSASLDFAKSLEDAGKKVSLTFLN